jgi:YidC/Oxa1 family membrane protein insertase
LTRNAGILQPIATLLGYIMTGIFKFFDLFGIQNIALSIVVFTFIVRALMLPLTIKQQKFTKISARMNPELQKIQAKYKGKKDQESLKKMQIEQQALYEKYGANPTSGCLPLVITLPIMFALYYVIYNIPGYVGQIRHMYEAIAVQIQNVPGYEAVLKTAAASNTRVKISDYTSMDNIIYVLSQIGTAAQTKLAISMPTLTDQINQAFHSINRANNFFGMNITDKPNWKSFEIIIPILAAVLSYVQSKQVAVKSKDNNNKDNPAAAAMNSMMYVMPLMQFFFCVTFPLGIGIYWIATSVFTIIQQFFVNRVLDRMNVDELIEKSVAKAAKKKHHTVATTDSTGKSVSLRDLAKTQTKYIESPVTEKKEEIKNTENTENTEEITADTSVEEKKEIKAEKASTSSKQSISEIANLLKDKKL